MHELSVAQHLVELIEHELRDAGRVRVTAVLLRVGPLSGVEPAALRFAYDSATAGTMLAGSTLTIEDVRPAVFCETCSLERQIDSVQRLRCPVCDAPTPNLVRGRELEVVSVEVVDAA
jgi:hydrogenase nickel incorporation protein HypA/HybF